MTPADREAANGRSLRPVWISGLTALALFASIAAWLSPLEPGVLVLQMAWTPQAFGNVVHAWPAEHLARYRAHLPFDMLLLAAYAAFGHLLVSRTALFDGLPARLVRDARWMLPLAALCDATENAFHAWLTEVPRFGVAHCYAASALASMAKWLLILSFGALVLFAAARSRPAGR
ncbi:MAG TPA: hypothetical protein VFV17_00350 [Usitatibacteraceae bacterium]|nr:hypothetical protein [Usitatibacteraceae bacterium]